MNKSVLTHLILTTPYKKAEAGISSHTSKEESWLQRLGQTQVACAHLSLVSVVYQE